MNVLSSCMVKIENEIWPSATMFDGLTECLIIRKSKNYIKEERKTWKNNAIARFFIIYKAKYNFRLINNNVKEEKRESRILLAMCHK